MTFDLSVVWTYKEVLMAGLFVTLELSVLIVSLGTVLGLLLAFGKKSQNWFIRKVSSLYSDFFRTMPFLIMLVWVYYALPILAGIRLGAFETAVLVLSLHLSAYVGELVRSGIEAIPQGEIDAARTLGLKESQIMRIVILPQVFRQLLSPLAGLYIEEVKNTTLASIIAVNELLHSGQILISQTYRPLEIYTTIAIVFVVILWPLTYIPKRLELSAFVKKASSR